MQQGKGSWRRKETRNSGSYWNQRWTQSIGEHRKRRNQKISKLLEVNFFFRMLYIQLLVKRWEFSVEKLAKEFQTMRISFDAELFVLTCRTVKPLALRRPLGTWSESRLSEGRHWSRATRIAYSFHCRYSEATCVTCVKNHHERLIVRTTRFQAPFKQLLDTNFKHLFVCLFIYLVINTYLIYRVDLPLKDSFFVLFCVFQVVDGKKRLCSITLMTGLIPPESDLYFQFLSRVMLFYLSVHLTEWRKLPSAKLLWGVVLKRDIKTSPA